MNGYHQLLGTSSVLLQGTENTDETKELHIELQRGGAVDDLMVSRKAATFIQPIFSCITQVCPALHLQRFSESTHAA